MDMCAAVLSGRLTGKAEQLTIGEFAERVAGAASRALSETESSELAAIATPAKKMSALRRKTLWRYLPRSLFPFKAVFANSRRLGFRLVD